MDDNTIIINASGTAGDSFDLGSKSGDTVVIDLSNMSSSMTYPYGGYTYNWNSNLTVSTGDPGSNFDGISVYLQERDIIEEHREAESLRERHPGVQAAWEQYQIMLNLARDDEQNNEKS